MGERFKQAQADIKARREEMDAASAAGSKPSEVVQSERVQPEGVSQPREEAPAPADEKLGENKFGMSVWRKGDGTFVKRYPDGREEGITSTVADLLTKQGAWKPAETSEAEKIREAAQVS